MSREFSLVTIVGAMGSGKSTLSNELIGRLDAETVPMDDFFQESPFLPLEQQDRSRWSLTGDLWFLSQRIKRAGQLVEMLNRGNVVLDSGILMDPVYAKSRVESGFSTSDEWKLFWEIYTSLSKTIPASDLVVFLEASAEFLRERIVERGREFEVENYSIAYIESIIAGLDFLKDELTQIGIRYLSINVEETGNEEQLEMIIESISRLE